MSVGLEAMRGFHPQATTGAVAGAIDSLVATFSKHMNDMYTKVDASQDNWKGAAATAANQRALGERLAGNTLIGELDDIAQAYRKHGSAMDGYCSAAVKAADDYLRQGFNVADDGTVSVPAGKKDVPGATPGQTIPMSAEQLATYAVEASSRVKGLINQFNAEDLALAQAAGQELLDMVQKAAGEQGLGSWTMDTIDSGSTGAQDGLLVADRNASPEQMRLIADRLAEAGLTAQDIADINSGKDVELTEAQFAYLHSFYNTAGKDGLVWMTEQMSSGGDTVHAASVVNGLNTLANPNVGATGIGPTGNPMQLQGGLSQIPTGLSSVLTRDYPVQDGNRTKVSNINGGELQQVTSMLALGDKMTASGSDINRELLETAGDLADSSGHRITADGGNAIVGDLVQSMVETAGEDKIAVQEVLADQDKRENIFGELLTNQYQKDDGAAVENMLSWIEGDATSPDQVVSERAGSAAQGLATYVSEHQKELLNINGEHSESLSAVNPLATQGIASALSPYIANLAGVPDDSTTTNGFSWGNDGDHKKAAAIFSVIDSDKDAATYFNAKAFLTTAELQQSWMNSVVANPDEPAGHLASGAGVVRGLIDKGLEIEAEDRGKDAKVSETGGFASNGAAYDGAKGLIGAGLKYTPVVKDIVPPIIDMTNTYAKNSIVGLYLPPETPDTTVKYNDIYDPARQNYQLVQALQTHGIVDHSTTYDYMFNSDGTVKDYSEILAAKGGNEQVVSGNLANVLNSSRGGSLHDSVQDYHISFDQGRGSVK